ncbi:MAG: carboxypeptidase-like regulatory domain-containing protein [Clostridium sp.]|nr:carboxypeptidase-like regulatory domain-containing protein [Clostridium sp.]MCM1547703.1 carboxypeptidase-like regulatory domain-containing protein [Ruminococcus sp.]
MNKDDLINDSQRYLDEMMRFYSQNKDASVNTQKDNEVVETDETVKVENETFENSVDESVKNESETPEDREDVSAEESNNENSEPESMNYTAVELPPIPVIPDNTADDISDEAESKPESPVYSDHGFLKIEVRTGRNGLPVPGAAVTVSEKNGSGENIIFSGITDESGEVDTIKLPAPNNSMGSEPSTFSSYAVYTVSAYFKGFYRSVSADVPVFAGITSIQRFDLIPLPYDYDDSGQSIVNENTEPDMPQDMRR